MTLPVCVLPSPKGWPQKGGVREHLIQLRNHMLACPAVRLVDTPAAGTVLHVESSYTSPRPPDVYVCHGGFKPHPSQAVVRNLRTAGHIVSVAKWLVDAYFPEATQTRVIHNGVDLNDWVDVASGSSGIEPGYILYAKEWPYFMPVLEYLTVQLPAVRFVTTVWREEVVGLPPPNVTVIGLQTRERIREYVKDCGALLLTGVEVCPTMLLETWAAGRPVIAFNDPPSGSHELMTIERKVKGGALLEQPYDAPAQVLSCLERGDELGAEGRVLVEQYFQWSTLIDQYMDVWTTARPRHPRKTPNRKLTPQDNSRAWRA